MCHFANIDNLCGRCVCVKPGKGDNCHTEQLSVNKPGASRKRCLGRRRRAQIIHESPCYDADDVMML